VSDTKYEIEIKTVADLQAARAYLDSLKQQRAALRQLGQDASAVDAQIARTESKASAAASKFASDAEGQSGAITGLFSGAFARVATIAAGAAAAIGYATESVRAFAEQERGVAKLDAALARNADLSNETHEKYLALADSLAELTGQDHGAWVDVLARLTQFGAASENIDKHAEAVKNLAGVLDGDLNSAALLVSRAIQGNFSAFRRWGIQLDENATQAERLDSLYRQLAQRGGGQLEAQSKTLSGQFKRVSVATQDVAESIGGLIARTGIVQSALGGLTRIAQRLASALDTGSARTKGLANAQASSAEAMGESEDSARRWEEQLKKLNKETQLYGIRLEAARASIEDVRRAQEELTNAKTAAQLAQVDQAEKTGQISGTSATQLRALIKQRADSANASNQFDAAKKTLAVNFEDVRSQQSIVARLEQRINEGIQAGAVKAEVNSARGRFLNAKSKYADASNAFSSFEPGTSFDGQISNASKYEGYRLEDALKTAAAELTVASQEYKKAQVSAAGVKGDASLIPQLREQLKIEKDKLDVITEQKRQDNARIIDAEKARTQVGQVNQVTSATQTQTELQTAYRSNIQTALQSGAPIPQQPSIGPIGQALAAEQARTGAATIDALQSLINLYQLQGREIEKVNAKLDAQYKNSGLR